MGATHPMSAARLLATLLAVAAVVAGCGSSGGDERFDLRTPAAESTPPASSSKSLTAKEPISRMEERVIRRWASTLRHGDVARAARYFALPAIVANGFDPLPIRTRKEARQFNELLPCGAKVVALERQAHHLVLTTFRLVNRTGRGAQPCEGGGTAYTAFRIRHNRITQWLRVPEDEAASGGAAQSSS
jgi:hypothetical protein